MNWKKIIMSVHFQIFVVVCGIGFIYSRYAISIDETLDNPLIRAAATGDYDAVKDMLKRGMSPNKIDEISDGPLPKSGLLAVAVWNSNFEGNRKVVDLLLTHQANVRQRDLLQQCPIHKISRIDLQEPRMDILSELIMFGADIEAKDYRQSTFIDVVVELLDTTFISSLFDIWGKILTPQLIADAKQRAEDRGFLDMVELIKKGARKIVVNAQWDPAAIDSRIGLNDLHFAVIKNDIPLVKKIIVDKRLSPNTASQNRYGFRPLHFAVLQQRPQMVTVLVENSAQVTSTDLFGNSPLHYVASLSDKKVAQEIADYLLQKGANLNAVNNEGNTLLHTLIYMDDTQLIESIGKKYSFNRNIQNLDRETALDLVDRLNRKYLLKNIK